MARHKKTKGPRAKARLPLQQSRSGPQAVSAAAPATLNDTARASAHRSRSFWDSNTKLRDNAVRFVPASGVLEETEEIETTMDDLRVEEDGPVSSTSPSTKCIRQDDTPVALDSVHPVAALLSMIDPPYTKDAADEASVRQNLQHSLQSHPSGNTATPEPDEDVITFTGRAVQPTCVHDRLADAPAIDTVQPVATRFETSSEDDSKLEAFVNDEHVHATQDRGQDADNVFFKCGLIKDAASNDPLADYAANLVEHGFVTSDSTWQSAQPTNLLKADRDGWDSQEIRDFDGMSTSDELPDSISQVLSKRHRSSGVQYLVVTNDQTVDEARWLPQSLVNTNGASKLIEVFEEAQTKLFPGQSSSSSELAIQDSEDNDEYDGEIDDLYSEEGDSFEDERDLYERYQNGVDDEQIARLLAKQEELGLGSDELLLLDETVVTDDFDGYPADTKRPRRKKSGSRNNAATVDDLDDILEQEGYGAFDILDRNRPSLQPGLKARDKQVLLVLSDSELEASLQAAWATDRKAKRLRKQQREELRAQGLLGVKNDTKPNLAAKYKEGMSIANLQKTLEDFLESNDQSCALPPLDKKNRKIVHEIASVFNLKSKSVGKGRARFPVIYRTSRTIGYDEALFTRVQAGFHRKFLPRMDQPKKSHRRKDGSGLNGAGVSYREGEVVGATAPELGSENRGRAMLEKMGWSTGTALGAIHNKGSLQPVTHVVKITKAGLG